MPDVTATGTALSGGNRLRRLWAQQAVAVPGVFNALVARMAERLGYQAIYLSGAALSAAAAVPDVGLLTLTEFVAEARTIASATSLPLLCDADTGFGEALNVERTVRLFEAAGAAGIHIEDQQLPKRCGHLSGKQLVEPEVMAAPVVWLASDASNDVTGRRFVAARWDPSLPADKAAETAGAPVAWTGFGHPAIYPPT